MRSNHFAIFGSREIGRSLLVLGYSPSLDRHITLATFPLLKKDPLSAHLLNRTVIIAMYSGGSFFRMNAEVPILSVDFCGRNLRHYVSTYSYVIFPSGIAGKECRL